MRYLLQAVLGFSFLLTGYVQSGQSQTIVEGKVTDEVTGEPLPGANVFIQGTRNGDNTDVNGDFSFETTRNGRQIITVSFIGYHTINEPVMIADSVEMLPVSFKLRIEEYPLEDIIITADNREWQRNFGDFRREFLGATSFALNTEILNKWAIDFLRKPNGEISASAREPILVENRALGYRIEVELHDFKWQLQDDSGYFLFNNIRFEEMKPENRTERRRWEANRERAYRGSFRHFLNSLYSDQISRNRFSIVSHGGSSRTVINKLDRSMAVVQTLMAYRIPASELDKTVKVFHLREPLDVVYGARGMGSDHRPRATLTPRSSNNTFIVHKDGYLIDGRSLSLGGVWKNTRIASMLPPDYLP